MDGVDTEAVMDSGNALYAPPQHQVLHYQEHMGCIERVNEIRHDPKLRFMRIKMSVLIETFENIAPVTTIAESVTASEPYSGSDQCNFLISQHKIA